MEIAEKLNRYEDMAGKMAAAAAIKNKEILYDNMIAQLKSTVLMYDGKDGNVYAVGNFDEYQQLKRQRQDESLEAEKLSQQNDQLSQHSISKERQRPSQQLEPVEQWADIQADANRQSVILIDHQDKDNEMIGGGNQQQQQMFEGPNIEAMDINNQQEGSSIVENNDQAAGAQSNQGFNN